MKAKTKTFSLLATLLVSTAILAACDNGNGNDQGWQTSSPTRYCVDAQGVRVPDNQCGNGNSNGTNNAFLWYYLGTLSANNSRVYVVPQVGQHAYGGSFQPSPRVSYSDPVASYARSPTYSARASSISRGGFGASAEGHAGSAGE